MIIILFILSLITIYVIHRLRKYPTERGLRLPTLLSIPPIFLQLPLLRLANRILRSTCKKRINMQIERKAGGNIPAAFYKAEGKRPLLIYIHGGGFFFTAPAMAYNEAERYSNELNFNVVFPDYTTSDEKPYPASFNDIRDTLAYFISNKEKYALTDEIYVAGDSAGGALAIELTKYAVENNIKIKKLLLIYPVIDDKMKTLSMKTFNDSPLWNARLNKRMWEIYLREGKGEYAVPDEVDNLSSFPETYIEVEEYDSLKDEGLEFAGKLQHAEIPVTLISRKRTYHGFDYFKTSESVRKAKEERLAFLRDN